MAKAFSAVSGNGLKARFIRSFGWSMMNFGGAQFLRLISNLILTRLLFPEAFGLMALVTVILVGLAMFSDTGITTAVQQNARGDDPDFLDTARSIQIVRGCILWLITWPLGWAASVFYEAPLLAWLLPAAGLTLIIDGFKPTRTYTAQRHLKIGRLTAAELSAAAVGLVVTCGLAWWLGTIWALVYGTVATAASRLLFLYLFLDGRRDRLRFDRASVLALMHFGKWIFLSTICGFLTNQGDRLILGKFLTLETLGIYNIAFFLASFPSLLSKAVMKKVMVSYLREKPPGDSRDNFLAFRRIRFVITGGFSAATIGFALAGPFLVTVLYDARYAAAGSMLVLIALVSLPALLTNSYPLVCLAKGDSRSFAIVLSFQSVLSTAGLLIGVLNGGLVGALLGLCLARILQYPIAAFVAHRDGVWDPKLDAALTGLNILGVAVTLYFHLDKITELLIF